MSRPLPILFIHGFQGRPEQWDLTGFRPFLVARGADPALLRLFHYGLRDDGRYDNEGDVRRIAARLARRDSDDSDALASQVARLSEASVARGGPARVTVVAHSLGGLVARYYLQQRTPDEWGTMNEGVVQQLITIGTPHLGVELAEVVRLVPQESLIVRLLALLERWGLARGQPSAELRAVEAEAEAMQHEALDEVQPVGTQGYLDSPAVRQLLPGSAFLQALNAPGSFPSEVEVALLWGDVQLGASVHWGPATLWRRTVTLGDLLVSAASASSLPPAPAARYPFLLERHRAIRIGQPALASADLNALLPPVAHSNLLRHPELQRLVARLVAL